MGAQRVEMPRTLVDLSLDQVDSMGASVHFLDHKLRKLMEKSVDLLVKEHQWVAWLSVVSLVSFTASVVIVAIVGGDAGRHGLDILAGCMMGVLVTSAFVAMVGATFAVVRNRARLADWGMFLIFIWCVPYLGMTFYLSLVFLMGLLGRSSRVGSRVRAP